MTKSRNIRQPGPAPSGMPRVPNKNRPSYLAGVLIYAQGPKSEADLFAAVDFGSKPNHRVAALDRAVQTGWLVRIDGLVALTDFARAHFDGEPEPKPAGQVAGPRSSNLMQRPAYVQPKRFVRDDVPAYSVRATPNFHKG